MKEFDHRDPVDNTPYYRNDKGELVYQGNNGWVKA